MAWHDDNPGACFVAGTRVATGFNPDGSLVTRSIEDVQVGDLVLSRDQHDEYDDLTPRKVTQVFKRTSDHIRMVTIEGDDGNVEVIQTTDEHPFYVRGKGWTSAASLQAGDLVQETDGSWQAVLASTREDHPDGITVYNLEVEGDHTYFVEDGFGGVDAVWVHNNCEDTPDLNVNKIHHLFNKPGHNLSLLESKFGHRGKAMQVLVAANKATLKQHGITDGEFEHVVHVEGIAVTVRGIFVGGEPRIGTAFIPGEL